MCDLCELEGYRFKLTICRTCNIPMVVLNQHRAEFNAEERKEIERIFLGREIRWEQRQNKVHAHAHILT